MILALSTASLQYGLALVEPDGGVKAECFLSEGGGHFGGLMPALEFLLSHSGVSMEDIRAVAVTTGPGSFTGLRVGLALAKGLCHGLEIPVLGVSSLEALALQAPQTGPPVTAVIDSRRSELFAAQFRWQTGGRLQRKTEDTCFLLADFPARFPEPTIFVGNHLSTQAPLLRQALGPGVLLAPAHLWGLKATSVALSALERFRAGEFDDPLTLTPRYLRPPDIRPNPIPVNSAEGPGPD